MTGCLSQVMGAPGGKSTMASPAGGAAGAKSAPGGATPDGKKDDAVGYCRLVGFSGLCSGWDTERQYY